MKTYYLYMPRFTWKLCIDSRCHIYWSLWDAIRYNALNVLWFWFLVSCLFVCCCFLCMNGQKKYTHTCTTNSSYFLRSCLIFCKTKLKKGKIPSAEGKLQMERSFTLNVMQNSGSKPVIIMENVVQLQEQLLEYILLYSIQYIYIISVKQRRHWDNEEKKTERTNAQTT